MPVAILFVLPLAMWVINCATNGALVKKFFAKEERQTVCAQDGTLLSLSPGEATMELSPSPRPGVDPKATGAAAVGVTARSPFAGTRAPSRRPSAAAGGRSTPAPVAAAANGHYAQEQSELETDKFVGPADMDGHHELTPHPDANMDHNEAALYPDANMGHNEAALYPDAHVAAALPKADIPSELIGIEGLSNSQLNMQDTDLARTGGRTVPSYGQGDLQDTDGVVGAETESGRYPQHHAAYY